MNRLGLVALSLAVAKAVCLGQKRAPACIGWPQRGQVVVWVVTGGLIYPFPSSYAAV